MTRALFGILIFALSSNQVRANEKSWCATALRKINRMDYSLGIGDTVSLERRGARRAPIKATFLGATVLRQARWHFLFFLHPSEQLVALDSEVVALTGLRPCGRSNRVVIQALFELPDEQTEEDCSVQATNNAIEYLDWLGLPLPIRVQSLRSMAGGKALLQYLSQTPIRGDVRDQRIAESWRSWSPVPSQSEYRVKVLKNALGIGAAQKKWLYPWWKHLEHGYPAVLDMETRLGVQVVRIEDGKESVQMAYRVHVPGREVPRAEGGHSVLAISAFRTGNSEADRKVFILDSALNQFAVWDYRDLKTNFIAATIVYPKPQP